MALGGEIVKICYVKSGDVVKELETAVNAKSVITGGHDYYVYSMLQAAVDGGSHLLLLSCSSQQKIILRDKIVAKVFKISGHSNILKRIFSMLMGFWKIFISLINFHPDNIVCTNILFGLLPSFCYSKLYSRPLYVSVHSDIHKGHIISKKIIHHIIKKSNSIICHGPFLKNQVIKLVGNQKKVYEYNGGCSDLLSFTEFDIPNDISENGKYKLLTYVGRIEENKGIFDLLNAARMFLHQNSNVRLVYAGDGGQLRRLRNEIDSMKLSMSVFTLGRISRQMVASLIAKSWVLIVPTQKRLSEGRCMSAVEALSLGVPIIVPKYGFFEYIVKNYVNGLFFKADNISDLAKKIQIIKDESLRQSLSNGALNEASQYLYPEKSYYDVVADILK